MKYKKSIAIQLFGHMRSFQKTYSSLQKHIIKVANRNGFDVDIFIHTWNEIEHTDIRHHYKMDIKNKGKPLLQKHIDFINSNYKPKSILIEKQLSLTEQEQIIAKKHNITDKISKNMAYTFYKVNELRKDYEKKKNIKYDFVIITRPDIIFFEDFNFDFVYYFSKEDLNNTLFYTDALRYDIKDYNKNQNEFICGVDLFIISGIKSINKICKEWYENKRYLIEHKAENNISKIIKENNIQINMLNYQVNHCWNIKRTNELKDKFLISIIIFILNCISNIMHPLLIYSTSYQKRIYWGGVDAKLYTKTVILKNILKFISIFTPTKKLRSKVRNLYK